MADHYFAELVQSNRCFAVSLRRLSWACTLMKGSISGFIKHRRLGEEPVLICGCVDEAYSRSDAGRPKELLKIGLDPRPMDFRPGRGTMSWDTFAFCVAEDADSGWTDARHPSENFQECSCFGLFKFCQFLTQVVSTCCLYVGMLPRSTWQVYYYASQAPTFRVCHKTLQRFRRFHDFQWKPGADGMDPELHWYGCHPRNTDLVDLASGGIGENIQSVCHMAWEISESYCVSKHFWPVSHEHDLFVSLWLLIMSKLVFVNRSLKNLSFPASFQPSSQFLWWCI